MTERELLLEAIEKYVEAGDRIGNYNIARRLLMHAVDVIREDIEVLEAVAKPPYKDSDLDSLLKTLRTLAQTLLEK